MDVKAWRRRLEQFRREKDSHLKHDPHSPLPPDARARFRGLRYYKPDPAYRVETTLTPAEPATLSMPRSGGDAVTYLRVGTMELHLPAGHVRLAAYRRRDQVEGYFVPFRDATSGTETYGAGRYLDVPGQGRHVTVDLNYAYHPFCAYNQAYSCPLPPRENWLTAPVPAGERL